MVKEPWGYDSRSHQVILNVKGNRHGRRRKKVTPYGPSLLNRPRIVVLGVVLTILVFLFLRETRFVLAYHPQFKIRHIQIENAKLLDRAVLLELLGLKEGEYTLIGVSARELSRRLEGDPDIESVIVEKRFPDTIRVVVNERMPYLRVRAGEKEYTLDYNGVVLWREREKAGFIPLVLGVEAEMIIPGEVCSNKVLSCALDLLRTGNQLRWGRFIEIAEVDMRDFDRILIRTRERILIKMTGEEVKGQLEKLVLILADVQRRGKVIGEIDLRYKDTYIK